MDPEQRDAFGIIVSYTVKVKLYLGALNGELTAELPFILMHPKVKFCFCFKLFFYIACWLLMMFQPEKAKLIHADSQADVEMFRQDTICHQESVDVYWKK